MATYLQGQQDYITQIKPSEPNLAFDAQMLQTKQAKYDANYKKVSELYGSILNSAMSRADNIQAREEFFKMINNDIQRMGGLDFSLDQNVQAAANVFQSIYTNKGIVKDMVWTKNYDKQVDKMESFKNCLDEDKCGGLHWDEGEKFLAYKKREFQNATAKDALSMEDVEYTPYKSVMKQSIKLAKEAGLNVEIDSFDGGYVVTTQNGVLLRTPLTNLFAGTIGQDPNFQKQFKVKAFVDRNDWINSKVATGEFNSNEEAQLGYLREVNRRNQLKIAEASDKLNTDVEHIDSKLNDLRFEFQNGGFNEKSDLYKTMIGLEQLSKESKVAQQYLESVNKISVMDNKSAALSVMSDAIDEQTAAASLLSEIEAAAFTLSNKNAKVSLKADEFAKMAQDFKYDMAKLQQQHRNAVALEQIEFNNQQELEEYKKSIGHSSYSDKSGGLTADKVAEINTNLQQKLNEIESFDPAANARAKFKNTSTGEPWSAETVDALSKAAAGTNENKKYKEYLAELKKQQNKLENLQLDANNEKLKLGEAPLYPKLLSKNTLQQAQNKLNWYKNAWKDKRKLEFADAYLSLYSTGLAFNNDFDEAYDKASNSENLVEAITAYFEKVKKEKNK